jgi:hypothetical protein
MNAKLRAWNMVFLGFTVAASMVGWLIGRDPSQLVVVFGALTGTTTALEAGNVGKRATFKKEAVSNAEHSSPAPAGSLP